MLIDVGAGASPARARRDSRDDVPVVVETRATGEDLQRHGPVLARPSGRRREGHRPHDPPRRDARHRRRVGIGQVDGRPLRRPADRPERPARSCLGNATSPGCRPARCDRLRRKVQIVFQDPVPLAQPAPHRRPVDHRGADELRPLARGGVEAGARTDGAGPAGPGGARPLSRTSSPAASASGSASPARWRWNPNC